VERQPVPFVLGAMVTQWHAWVKCLKFVSVGSELATESWFVATFRKFVTFDRGERVILWDIFGKQFFKIVIKPLSYFK